MAFSLRVPVLPQEIPPPESLDSPLPGGLASVVRFFLDFPQPLQIAGIVVGVVLADHIKNLDWQARRVEFEAKASPEILSEVRERLRPLLGL